MILRYKIIIGVTSAFVLLTLLVVAFFFWFITPSKMEEQTISNGQYAIKTQVFEADGMDFLTFNVLDNDNNIVFECKENWRCWDFKEIKFLDGSNDIYVYSADVGTTIYRFTLNENSKPIWVAD